MTTTLRRSSPLSLFLVLLAVVALLGAACGDDDNGGTGAGDNGDNTTEQGDALDTVAKGKLTVCTDIPYPPFEYEDNGRVVGIDADLMRAIGGRLGLAVEFRDTDFDGIFAAAQAGQCDLVASSVSITDERKQTLDFSDGYYEIVQSMLVRKADEAKYKDFASLRGRTIGVQSETTGADFAKEQAQGNDITVREYTTADEAITALKAGQVDAVVQDFPVNAYMAKAAGDLAVSARFEAQKEQYGFAMPKGRDELLKAVDDALRQIRQDDTYNKILEQ
jgi:polar amino acid transport system substrate-binding protein